MDDCRKIDPDKLKKYCATLFEKIGVPADEAAIVGDSLVEADLTGVESHGVSRVGIYMKRLEEGVVEKNAQLKVLSEFPGGMVIDGCNSMGVVTSVRAMRMGMEKAKESGVVFITIRNSNHFGTAAYFTKMAARENMIAYACSNAPSTMAPWGSFQKYLGTNPFSVAVPTADEPIVLDMATSVVARGKIVMSDKKGESIPEGWAITKDGAPTTNAKEALDGTVLPFGGPKGYGIALMIDIMSGILSGASFGTHLNEFWDVETPQSLGHNFLILNVSKFVPADEFSSRIDQMKTEIKALPKIDGVKEIFMPGEIELNKRKANMTNGMELPEVVTKELTALGERFGLKFDVYK